MSVNLTQHWPVYLVALRGADNMYRNVIVDTGNAQLTLMNRNWKYNNKTEQALDASRCLVLLEDLTTIQFSHKDEMSGHCPQYRSKLSLSGAQATVNYTIATNVTIDNPLLHPWSSPNIDGDIGLAYCNTITGTCQSGQSDDSAYFQFIKNVTGHVSSNGKVFGLDFYTTALHNGVSGSMQIGGVLPWFGDVIQWAQQSTDQPTYHEAFLYDLNICGINLLSELDISSWPVIVDTGVACMAFPAQIYDVFVSWLDTTSVPDTTKLPAIAFRVENNQVINENSMLYVPLSSLLVNASLFKSESGAPEILIGGVQQRLCVLKSTDAFGFPAPRIVLGAMALHSLYFAADVYQRRTGLANKIGPTELLDHINNDKSRCRPRTTCKGLQTFSITTNTCNPPDCESYFFTTLDPVTQTCLYRDGAVGVGIFFICVVVILEGITFFVTQFSALEILHARERHSLAISKVDFVTRNVGKILTAIVDGTLVIVHRHFGIVRREE